MKKLKKSVRTKLLLAAALLLMAFGTVGVTRAALTYYSEDYVAWFYLNHLHVHLLENGRDVCGGVNTLDGDTKITGELVAYMEDKLDPGRTYREEIAAQNGSDIEQYLRLTIRRYWVDQNGNKSTALSPSMIHLTYNDPDVTDSNDLYNTDVWMVNPIEHTTESDTYYYTSILPGNAKTPDLFNQLTIDKKLYTDDRYLTEETVEEDGVRIYRYTYSYDEHKFVIEATVQAIQTHNAQDAIHSQWGVYNVTVDGTTLHVN